MNRAINLLPRNYVASRRQDRRFRVSASLLGALLCIELITGLFVHARAEETRSYTKDAEDARRATEQARAELKQPTRDIAMLNKQIMLAERLRITPLCIRLLQAIANKSPARFVLSVLFLRALWRP